MAAIDEADRATLAYIASLVRAEQEGASTSVAVGPWSAFCLISGLQLTLRHPDLGGELKEILTSLCQKFGQLFEGTPGQALVAAGFDPGRDVARPADLDVVDYCDDQARAARDESHQETATGDEPAWTRTEGTLSTPDHTRRD